MKSLAFSMRKAKFFRLASACRMGVTLTRAAIQPTTRPSESRSGTYVHCMRCCPVAGNEYVIWYSTRSPASTRLMYGSISFVSSGPRNSSTLRPTICAGVTPKRSAFALFTNLKRRSGPTLARMTGT